MTSKTGIGASLSGRGKHLIVTGAVIGLLMFAVWLFLFIGRGGYTWSVEARISEADLRSPERLTLFVDSCNKKPEVLQVWETDVDVQVKVIADSHPFLLGGGDCRDSLEVQLQGPLEDRVLVDANTGQLVSVRAFGLPDGIPEQPIEMLPEMGPPQIDDPLGAAELEDLRSIADREGISLQEAINRYGWHNNFSLAVSGIRREFPEDFTRSEIVGAAKAWVGFAGSAPEGALELLERFASSRAPCKTLC